MLSIIGGVSMHLRYNALILFPLILFTIFYFLKRGRLFKTVRVLSLLPIIIYFIIRLLIQNQYEIKEQHHSNGIMFLDIIGVIVDNPDIINEFPYIKKNLEPYYEEKYIHGDLGPLLWTPPLILKNSNEIIRKKKNKLLQNEYKKMIFKYPFKLILYKIKCFKGMILANNYKVLTVTNINEQNLNQNTYFSSIRIIIDKVERYIFSKIKSVNYTLRGNTIWFILNIVFILKIFLKKDIKSKIFRILILLYPFFYYCSYIIVCPGGGHRYVYPSILVMQIFTFIYLLNKLFYSIKNQQYNF